MSSNNNDPSGRARPPGEPLPQRQKLPHEIPSWVRQGEQQFITINCKKRNTEELLVHADQLLKSAAYLKQGNFNFNSGSLKILKEHNTTHLQLLFDQETSRIAFKPCTKETPGAYALRSTKGGTQVSGMAFLKHCGIPFSDATRSCPATWEDNMLIIGLN